MDDRVQELLALVRYDVHALNSEGLKDHCWELQLTGLPGDQQLLSEITVALAEIIELEDCHRMEDCSPLFMSLIDTPRVGLEPYARKRLFEALKASFMKLSREHSRHLRGELMVQFRPDGQTLSVLREAWEATTGRRQSEVAYALHALVRYFAEEEETKSKALKLLEKMALADDSQSSIVAGPLLEDARRHLAEREEER